MKRGVTFAEIAAELRGLDPYPLDIVRELVVALEQLADARDRESALLSFVARHQPWELGRVSAALGAS